MNPGAGSVALVTSRVVAEGGRDPDRIPLETALRALGIEFAHPCWDDPTVDWAAYRLVVIRSTWDYDTRRDEFVAWAHRVADVVELCNPAEVVAVNTDKRYLGGLAARGLPVVPTWFFEPGAEAALPALEGDVVVKPATGAGARGVGRFSTFRGAEEYAGSLLRQGHNVLVQPYLAGVADGEIGLVYFDGAFSHAVTKTVRIEVDAAPAAAGGGPETIGPGLPTSAERQVADQVINACGRDLLYARVDLITDGAGMPRVAELELTEPAFFFDAAGASAEPLAGAITLRVGL